MKAFYVGQTVGHTVAIWQPQGKLTISHIKAGKRSTIIVATDERGKQHIGTDNSFCVLEKNNT